MIFDEQPTPNPDLEEKDPIRSAFADTTSSGKKKKNFPAWKWVFLVATPFVILITMAIIGFFRIANNSDSNSNQTTTGNQGVAVQNYNITVSNLNLSLRVDSDYDGLVDYLELRLGTGLTTYDTDSDTYFDGEEITGGFSPRGRGSFTGESFSDFCLTNFESTADLDYTVICRFVSEYIEVVRLMTQDQSGASDKDLDLMVTDFCLANTSDLRDCQSAIDLSLSLYMIGVTEVTNENINLNLNSNTNSDSETNANS